MAKDPITPVLAKLPVEQRAALEQLRATVHSALPLGEECLAWGMPSIRIDGVAVVCYQGFKNHNSLFPMSGSVVERLSKELARFEVTKGTIHFDRTKPFPGPLLRRIIAMRVEDINAGYPKKSGEMKQFYANGVLQSRGRMKGGEMHGAWEWFRKDGSLMRSGAFRSGVQVGEWVTYDRGGRVVRTTQFEGRVG